MRKFAVILAAIALFLSGSVAYAAIPDSNGVINACYKTDHPNKGNLIVLDGPGLPCPSGYVVTWWRQSAINDYTFVSSIYDIPAGYSFDTLQMSVACPGGSYPLGGGASSGFASWAVGESVPFYVPNEVNPTHGGWVVRLVRLKEIVSNQNATIYVTCAKKN